MNNIGKTSFDIGYMDTLACGDSPVHRLDPRAKLITTLVFIIAVVSFDKYTLLALIPFLIYPAALISVGNLPLGYILKKLLAVSPFAVLVGIFNPLMDSGIIFHIGSIGISGGWVSFLSILLRFVLTVTAALILVSLTGFNAVCESLTRFGVPRVFVVQLLFFYRYIFVLTDEAARMARAESLRSFNSRAIRLKTFISLLGHLLLRTLDRAERIYCAMRCRGFSGQIHIIKTSQGGYREVVFVLGWSLLFILLRCYNVPLVLGRVFTGGF
jgi:cobalt/nickel transport system permease protein